MQEAPADRRSLWADIRSSLHGTTRDFTTGSLRRAIVILSIPMVLEMLMESIFEVADIFFVAKLGADAVTAVGISASLLIIIFAIGMGFAMAATALVARRIGEKDPEEAAKAAFQAILAGVAVSIPLAIVGIIYAADLLRLMGASESVVEIGTMYCAIMIGSNGTILLLFLINAAFRGAGDAAVAMRALWIANLLNIALDPLLIFGLGPFPEMGVTGAAVASAIGRGLGVVYQVVMLLRGSGHLRLQARHLRVDPETMKQMLGIAWPGVIQYLVGTASWLVMIRFLAWFGSNAVAGYTIALRVLIFVLLPSWGMSNAAATLVGQNLGAGKPDRAERAVWITSLANAAFLALITVVCLLFTRPLILVFTDDPAVVAYGVECLRIISLSYIFFAFGMITVQAFNGAGDTVTPTWINLIAYWLFQVPLAYLLARPWGYDATGIFIAITAAQVAIAVLGVLWFRRGRWKLQAV